MLQCPHCGHRTSSTNITISVRVRLTGLDDGTYHEEEIERYGTDWGNLECCQCGQRCREDAALAAFEAASCSPLDDDIYDWYAAQTADCPQSDSPAHESYAALAAAWQFLRWQQDRGYAPTPGRAQEKEEKDAHTPATP